MGTDIHTVAQVRIDGKWEDLEMSNAIYSSLNIRRYCWFTFLDGTRSDVTNKIRYENITPISAPKGCPIDFDITEDDDPYCPYIDHNETWMGYGVSSWNTYAEILDHLKTLPPLPYDIGPLDALAELFKDRDPNDCRIVCGYDS